jgi:hypothetical protein
MSSTMQDDETSERNGPAAREPQIPAGAPEAPRVEVSAATVGRMLGLASASELKLLEGKVDLLSSKVNAIAVRIEKILSVLNSAPTGGDLERIDMQIGSIKTMVKEAIAGAAEGSATSTKKTGGRILSNVPEEKEQE